MGKLKVKASNKFKNVEDIEILKLYIDSHELLEESIQYISQEHFYAIKDQIKRSFGRYVYGDIKIYRDNELILTLKMK